MSRKRQRREALLWQRLTDLLIARHEVTGAGLAPRAVRDLIDDARDSGLPVTDFAETRTVDGERRATGSTHWAPLPVVVLLNARWPSAAYRFCMDLGALARDVGALGAKGVAEDAQATTRRWVLTAEEASRLGAQWEDLAPWLVVFSHVTDPDTGDLIWTSLLNWNERRGGYGLAPDRPECLAEWAQALGPAAGWAFAAGVPLPEAEEQANEGTLDVAALRTLDVAALRTLAALRGFRAPSPAALAGAR